MANTHRDIDPNELISLGDEYCDECIEAMEMVMTKSGPAELPKRHLPTIEYFLSHWLRRNHPDFHEVMLKKSQFYKAKGDEDHPLSDAIKRVDKTFKDLALDIIANEGRGIFYGKNALGMSDRQEIKSEVNNKTTVINLGEGKESE